MTEPNNNTSAEMTSGVTPGVLLKQARERQGLSIFDVAGRLCLKVHFVEDIERDDYSQMSAQVYAEGHVKSYAQLVGVPKEKIMAALANVQMNFAPVKPLTSMEHEKSLPIYQPLETSQQRSGLMVWGSILAVVILLGLVVMWWKGPSDSHPPAAPKAAPKTTTVNLQPTAGNPGNPSTPPAPVPSASSAPAPLPPPATSTPAASTTPTPVVRTAPPPKPANEQSVLQPSEFHNPGNAPAPSAQPAPPAVALPPPRSSD